MVKFGSLQLEDVALLVKGSTNKPYILKKYLSQLDVLSKRFVAQNVYYPDAGTLKKKDLVAQAAYYLESFDTVGIETLIVTDAKYFEYFTKQKLEKSIGQAFACVIPNYEHLQVLPMLNSAYVDMQPHKIPLQTKAITTINDFFNGGIQKTEEFDFESYRTAKIKDEAFDLLDELLKVPTLTCDIETTGLVVGPATRILSIAFATDMYNAVSIWINDDAAMLKLLKKFLYNYQGTLIFHNGLFDVKHLIYNCFMEDFSDYKGMALGINAINYDDTFILAYLALNSTVRPSLGLKDFAIDLLGDYAEDVKNAKDIPQDTLLKYNAKDTAATWYVYDRYKDQIDTRVYQEIMKPSSKVLLKMMLVGMPINLGIVSTVEKNLQSIKTSAELILNANTHTLDAVRILKRRASQKYNDTHKTKQKTPDEIDLVFNPRSSVQLRTLLFEVMALTPEEFTPTGQPKADRKSIEVFHREAVDETDKEVLQALIDLSQVSIILSTFITAFQELSVEQNGQTTLHGSLVLGGAQSGRLSSREPNMQNIPSHSRFGKIIKECFVAPDGFLFAGADFAALEDRIGAILSKDKNKTKEFLEGFDGHSVRALAFFPDDLPDLDPEDVEQVNSIERDYPEIRQNAKPISFLKQYGGGVGKIQQVLKCSKGRAQQISDAYDELYVGFAKFAQHNTSNA